MVDQIAVGTEWGKPVRLLVVADDVDHGAVVVQMLQDRLLSPEIRAVDDLAAARSALAEGPDLVLVDLLLPDEQGLEVVSALRTACPDTAVVVLCRHDDDDFALRAIAAGADDCVVKGSLDAQVLATVVTRCVERVRAQAARQRLEHFATSLLETTDSATCAVDRAGVVVSVNAVWRGYTADNHGDPALCGVGMDYLAACDDAQGEQVAGAAEVAAGLRAFLSGGLERFEHDYPCHGSGREQWFSARISPRSDGDGAVITHLDVTTSHLADRDRSRQELHDGVTGLPGAALLEDRLEQALGEAPRTGPPPVRPRTEAALREAMLHDELVVHYQPVVDLHRGVVVGVEALVRWQHPTGGLLAPDTFIPVAESGGLIVALGARVLEQACAQAVRWGTAGLGLHVAVNLSMRQVAHPDLVRTVQRTLRSTGLQPSRLVLEVTESAVSNDAAAAAGVLNALAELGVHLSIDDFGTGHSSLVYLRSYPVTALKIDRSFVAGMGASGRDDAIVASVLALARAIDGSCIAEGIETVEQHRALVALGCDYGQGWLYGRAVPADEMPALVQAIEVQLAQLRQGLVAVPEQPRDRDRRDLEGDARDQAADRRDAVAELRDDQALERDHASDQRDHAGDRRDRVGDQRDRVGKRRDQAGARRDAAADLRDRVADERDRAADARDDLADQRDELAEQGERQGLTATGSNDRSVSARSAAAEDRLRASQDRQAGAAERSMSELDRETAQADRGAGAVERAQAVVDRMTALADRDASAHERTEASVDALTGAYQRGAGTLELQREVERSRRTGRTLVVAFVDVDGLKRVNDEHGHATGDRVLADVSRTLAGVLRSYDLVVRYGGDEFLCAMPGLSLPEAHQRFVLVETALLLAQGQPSVSVGLAELLPNESVEAMVARADADLYRRRGRRALGGE